MKDPKFRIAVLGSGPAGLMAADRLSSLGFHVSLFEKRMAPGRKLLIAGGSGLNVTFDLPLEESVRHYQGPTSLWSATLKAFSPQDWLSFIEHLGIKTFLGTSRRYFVEGMKASQLLTLWKEKLLTQKVTFFFNRECTGFDLEKKKVQLRFAAGKKTSFDAVVFCLGGASWEETPETLRWPEIFKSKGLAFTDFAPANVGFRVNWSSSFLKEAEGLPLKNVQFTSSKGSLRGDLMITQYGLEGTPIYALAEKGTSLVDLKPDLTIEEILKKLKKGEENLSPLRKIKKHLKLCPASLALLYHGTDRETLNELDLLVRRMKAFPLELLGPEGLRWAISSSGGLSFSEIDSHFMLTPFPGVFAAGEMLDWDTITGGFLIQGCVTQGFCAANGVANFLQNRDQLSQSKTGSRHQSGK